MMFLEEYESLLLGTENPAAVLRITRHATNFCIETRPAAELAGFVLDRDLIRRAIGRTLNPGEVSPTREWLQQFGQRLFGWLVCDGARQIYDVLPGSHIRMQLHADHPQAREVPWEYLQHPHAPGPNRLRSLVRIVPTIGPPPAPPSSLRFLLRVLFVAAAPQNAANVQWDRVLVSLQTTFAAVLRSRGLEESQVKITVINGTTRDKLKDAIQSHDFDILHFSGHGKVVDGETRLVLEDGQGLQEDFSSADMMTLLGGRGLRLVVLSACETAVGDFDRAFAVLGRDLVHLGIPAVIATQMRLSNSTVAAFCGAFYKELLKSGDVDLAITEARISLALTAAAGSPAPLEWGVFTLYRHVAGAKVLS